MAHIEAITGRYVNLEIDGLAHRIFFEEAGQGVPLICMHTAGADSRQWRHLLNDKSVTDRFRVIAFDLPYHGRSTPPGEWWLTNYKLTTKHYAEIIRQFWRTLSLEKPILMGCSMAGAIVLKLAIDNQDELTGIIGLESSAYAPGRYNDFLHHPAVHGGELCASYTLGLCAPDSPESAKRENWWYYAQGGPGVYAGDVHFYSMDWDVRDEVHKIDTNKCKVSLLSGEYDYSATPEMSEAVAEKIKGSRYTMMKSMGHFPMIENYEGLKPYLSEALAHMVS
ncbi:alpha/beta fold hydrolase [Betaproteobacteria bacterium LSUCC0117]|jgi:pimeloyl-ACP methyl ester carboxylesterase|nr:alpha/beta fold hydrolase [Betaproteobacteria bacterium LSUCC0117]